MPRSTGMTPEQKKAFEYIKTVKKYYDDNIANVEARVAQEKLQYRGQLIQAVEDGVATGLTLNNIALHALDYKNLTGYQTFKHKYNSDRFTSGGGLVPAVVPTPTNTGNSAISGPTSMPKVERFKELKPTVIMWEDYAGDWFAFRDAITVGNEVFHSDDDKYIVTVYNKKEPNSNNKIGHLSVRVNIDKDLIFNLNYSPTHGLKVFGVQIDDEYEDVLRQIVSEAFPDADIRLQFVDKRPAPASSGPPPAINYADERVPEGGYDIAAGRKTDESMIEKYSLTQESIENTPVEPWHRKSTTPLGGIDGKKN